jgi:hypothetical protein
MKKISSLIVAGLFAVSAAHATLIQEKFTTDPALDGWQVFGDSSLFRWNPASHALDVTWDSSQTNSYFYHPLGRTFTKADSFCVQFDLQLTNVNAVGYFQLAIGLCNFAGATSTNFSRSTGISPNLFEFDYFPDGPNSWGPSIDATLVDSTNRFYFSYDATKPMLNNTTYRIVLIHRAGESAISGTVYTNGQVFTTMPNIDNYGPDDFQLDTFAIFNYTTLDETYGDSLFAQGTVDNLAFSSPLPVDNVKVVGTGEVRVASDTNWLYTLEQTVDFVTWTAAAPAVPGNGTNLILQATNPPAGKSLYRVRAELP